jgi:hypothetical protein
MWGKTVVVAMAAAVSLAVAAISLGAIPGATGTISGCYAKSNGSLRVIDAESGAACITNKETALSWNQQGPPGPQGPVGPQGPPGPVDTQMVFAVEETFDGFDLKFAHAACPSGETATGGGYLVGASSYPDQAQITVKDSGPSMSDSPPGETAGWAVSAIAPTGIGHWQLNAYAICTETAG